MVELPADMAARVVALVDQRLVVEVGDRALAEVLRRVDGEALRLGALAAAGRGHHVVAAGVDHEREREVAVPADGELLLLDGVAAGHDLDRDVLATGRAGQIAHRGDLVEQVGALRPVQVERRRHRSPRSPAAGRVSAAATAAKAMSYPSPTNHDRGIVHDPATECICGDNKFQVGPGTDDHATSFFRRARTGIVKSRAATTASQAALPTIDQNSGPVARPRVISTRW